MKNISYRRLYYQLRHRYLTMNNIVILIALLVAVGWAWGSIGMLERNYALQNDLDTKERQRRLAELELQTLQYQRRYYKSSEFQELSAREDLGLAFPGEKVFVLPPNTPSAKKYGILAPEIKPAVKQEPSNLSQWIDFLFGGNARDLRG